MLTLEIKESGVKDFMSKLLKEPTFDDFEVRGVEIVSFTRFEISGILSRDNVKTEDENTRIENVRNFCLWAELRPVVFQIVRGGKRPRSIRIVFSQQAEKSQDFHPNAAALFLNIAYENEANTIICTTATSQKNFTLERKMDDMWEDYIQHFLMNNDIISTQE